jgi:hypothetical protein
MGREAILSLGALGTNNFDLSSDIANGGYQDGWPEGRLNDSDKRSRWLHSDAREVAYRFNHALFEKWVRLGNLDAP